jgi:hypothetical protein
LAEDRRSESRGFLGRTVGVGSAGTRRAPHLLIVHPNQAAALRTTYAESLDDMLKSAGLELFANPRMTRGVAYVCEHGQVGTVGFEFPLDVYAWPEPSTRSTWVQGFVVPAFAVDRPFALKKLTSISS